jgi:hypothetical protein
MGNKGCGTCVSRWKLCHYSADGPKCAHSLFGNDRADDPRISGLSLDTASNLLRCGQTFPRRYLPVPPRLRAEEAPARADGRAHSASARARSRFQSGPPAIVCCASTQSPSVSLKSCSRICSSFRSIPDDRHHRLEENKLQFDGGFSFGSSVGGRFWEQFSSICGDESCN